MARRSRARWRPKTATQPPRASRSRPPARARAKGTLVVVGYGRIGGALARAFRGSGWTVAVDSRSETSRQRARRDGFKAADEAAYLAAAFCFLCVPDGAVAAAARDASTLLGPRAAVVHCAGALTLDALGVPGPRPRGSFHPLCAVSDAHDPIAGSAVALSADNDRLVRALKGLARSAHLLPFDVPEAGRAAYHAGAVLAAGGLVALASAAVEAFSAAGIGREAALRALVPLMSSALDGVAKRGLAHGLTGPVARGDASTLKTHLDVLPEELASLYRALSVRALSLAPALDAQARLSLEDLLRS